MEYQDLIASFQAHVQSLTDVSMPVAAIQALSEYISHSKGTLCSLDALKEHHHMRIATTMTEFIREVSEATSALKRHTKNCVSVTAGCELFTRTMTRYSSDPEEFAQLRQKLLSTIQDFGERSLKCREIIARLAIDFIQDNTTILIHSYSRVVMMLLMRAAAMNRRFKVFVTEARPTSRGFQAAQLLRKHDIPVTVILDAAIGYYIDKVDMVLVGAEGVVENGGIINQIGTYPIAVMAKAFDIPFYAVAERYKFVRCFPLNQYDLPTMSSALICSGDLTRPPPTGDTIDADHPAIDYTPPSYITLLFTDVGVLTPSAISDELIKLYY